MIQLVIWGAVFGVVFLGTGDPRAAFIALALCMLVERGFGLRREARVGQLRPVRVAAGSPRRTTRTR